MKICKQGSFFIPQVKKHGCPMNLIVLFLFILWIIVVLTLHSARLFFYKFMVGSVGLFCFIMFYFERILSMPMSTVVAMVAGLLGNVTTLFQTLPLNSLITISTGHSNISFYIDYECSGVVEIFSYSCLLWFYPLYNIKEKTILTVLGVITIFVCNVIRIFAICSLVYTFGDQIFFFAHTIFGRIIFYVCTVILYFNVFTKPHILRQKVGQFSYDTNS